jgi:hypothetical protein
MLPLFAHQLRFVDEKNILTHAHTHSTFAGDAADADRRFARAHMHTRMHAHSQQRTHLRTHMHTYCRRRCKRRSTLRARGHESSLHAIPHLKQLWDSRIINISFSYRRRCRRRSTLCARTHAHTHTCTNARTFTTTHALTHARAHIFRTGDAADADRRFAHAGS